MSGFFLFSFYISFFRCLVGFQDALATTFVYFSTSCLEHVNMTLFCWQSMLLNHFLGRNRFSLEMGKGLQVEGS